MEARYLSLIANVTQAVAILVLGAAALGLVVLSGLSFAGLVPWLEVSASFGGADLPWAGQAIQIGFAVLLLSFIAFIPSSMRVMRLENSHRRFEIDMDDVTRAYRAAHMADRAETFELRREFDAVRQRYKFLKDQPGLADIDDELLTIGAQMSAESSKLAETFSDRRVARVRENLKQRLEDAGRLEEQLKRVRAATADLERLRADADGSDARMAVQIGSLRDSLSNLEAEHAAPDPVDVPYAGSTKH